MMKSGFFVAGQVSGAPPLPTAQESCDRLQAEIRAATPRSLYRAPPPRPAALTPTPDAMTRRIADEIGYMQRIIEAVGETLASDAAVTSRHPQTLQQFDIVAQVLGHLASVIGSEDRDEAASRIGMSDLRNRLMRKSL